MKSLKEIGMDSLLIRERRHIGIRREGLDCDYYRMLEGEHGCGEYLPWSVYAGIQLGRTDKCKAAV